MSNAKGKLQDLNDHLFMQLERLDDDKLTGEELTEEIARSKAITGVAVQIIGTAKLALDAKVAIKENLIEDVPEMLGVKGYEQKKISR
ncbi:MAG: hypothetical protein KAT46_03825 [Deltaproteobacteria bacterium]|nr:hypothetical protein [Deltaproteobacteria bacterium]